MGHPEKRYQQAIAKPEVGRMKLRTRIWIGSIAFISLLWAALALAGQTPAPPAPTQNPQTPAQQQQQPPAAQTPANPDASADADSNADDQKYKLAVDVSLVNVVATVFDESGKYMDGLKRDDFKVFEDGQEQQLSFFSHDLRVPISIGILVDNSGSMKHKLQQALQTVREIALALSPQDEVFLISFNSEPEFRQHFTKNISDVQKSLRDLKAGGETAAYDAIGMSLNEMKRAKNNKKILLLVTDGFDTKSKINAVECEELLKHSDVLVYAIGIDDDENDPYVLRREKYHIYHYMLNKLTATSGGRAYRMFTGRTFALQTVAQLLLDELHQQYTLSYYPTSAREGNAWHSVEVKVSKTGSQIRHKVGYYVTQPGNNQ
jgi:Ca-activated chloride channel family protein